jgi:hypothetical protein
VVEHRQTFFRYNALDYTGILTIGVNIVPPQNSLADWRGDYTRSSVMIYNSIPSFDDLMTFADQFEKEFNSWVKSR